MTPIDMPKLLSQSFCQRFLLPAVCQNHTFVVAEILKRSNIDTNIRSNHGQTALSLAAERGYVDIVTLLLQNPSTDVNAQDSDGQTALGWAVFNEHVEIVFTLLQYPEVRIDIADIDGMTPLSWAIAGDCTVILVLLFRRLGVNPDDELLETLLRGSMKVVPVERSLHFNAVEGRWHQRYNLSLQSHPICRGEQCACFSGKRRAKAF